MIREGAAQLFLKWNPVERDFNVSSLKDGTDDILDIRTQVRVVVVWKLILVIN